MRFLFIMPADPPYHDGWLIPWWATSRTPPIGLISLMSYLHEKGHETKLVDCRHYILRFRTANTAPMVLGAVEHFRPDVIGINLLTSAFHEAEGIVRALEEVFPNIPILAGGPHPSVEPNVTLEQMDGLDAVCIGPGEEVCLDIAEGKDWTKIPGLMLKESPETYQAREVEKDIDRYPFPNYYLVNYDHYAAPNVNSIGGFFCRSIWAMASRSCPYSCKFCASNWSKPYRRHSPEYIIEMAKFLARFPIQWIGFVDDSIALSRSHLERVCEGFMDSALFYPRGRLLWKSNIRADQADPTLLKMMSRAGCRCIGLGVESGNNRILEFIDKKTTVEMNERAIRLIKEAGIVPSLNFVMGFPTETEKEMRDTIHFMRKSGINRVGIYSFKPLPGSPFYYQLLEEGFINKGYPTWRDLGDFADDPRVSFSTVPFHRLKVVFQEAHRAAYSAQYYGVFEHHVEGVGRSVIREVGNHDSSRSVRVLMEPTGNCSNVQDVSYGKWRWSIRSLFSRFDGDVFDENRSADSDYDNDFKCVIKHLGHSRPVPSPDGPFACVLLDMRAKQIEAGLEVISYSKSIRRARLTKRNGGFLFKPQDVRDHAATPYFKLASKPAEELRIKVTTAFSSGGRPDWSLAIYIQDAQYNRLHVITYNQYERPFTDGKFQDFVQVPLDVDRVRLMIRSTDGKPVFIPYRILVEQTLPSPEGTQKVPVGAAP